MAIDTTVWEKDLLAIIADLPAEMVWTNPGGTVETLDCLAGGVAKEHQNSGVGFFHDLTLVVVVSTTSFDNAAVYPQIGDSLTIKTPKATGTAVTHKVARMKGDPAGGKISYGFRDPAT